MRRNQTKWMTNLKLSCKSQPPKPLQLMQRLLLMQKLPHLNWLSKVLLLKEQWLMINEIYVENKCK